MGIFKKRTVSGLGEKKSDMPEGLWQRCPGCKETIYDQKLAKNLHVCPECGFHFTLSAGERIRSLLDEGTFEEMDQNLVTIDPLGFGGYEEKVAKYQQKTGFREAVVTGTGKLEDREICVAAMDFRFLAASMGSVVGEKITRAVEKATSERLPMILFSASGGARMQEGILSLMQMAKTAAALARHDRAGLPYVSVITNPTTGGVTASFATLGDIIIAEPGAQICFAGPRVIKETTGEKLPPGFQTAEFLQEHGLVDLIVTRSDMKNTLAELLLYMQPKALPSKLQLAKAALF
jgi:acetyl-CoA carboxylase carboxyl transferase subunit beta